ERSDQRDDPLIHELGFVDGNNVGNWIDLLADLGGGIGWNCLDGATVVARDRVNTPVPGVEVRLEYLDPLSRDDGAPDAADKLLALAAKHYPGNDFNPSTTLVEWSARPAHGRPRSLRGEPPAPRGGLSGGPPRPGGRPRSPRGPCERSTSAGRGRAPADCFASARRRCPL